MGDETLTARWQTSLAWLAGAVLTLGAATGCDNDESKSQEQGGRAAVNRDLPIMTPLEPWEPDVTIDAGLVDDLFADPKPGPCCDVDFALRTEDGEVMATLRGSDPPLDGMGVPLKEDDGVWRATVCMPADYRGFYYYEVYSAPVTEADAGDPTPGTPLPPGSLFVAQRSNPSAPEDTDAVLGTVNAFPPLDGCSDASAAVHSTLPESAADADAGP